MYCMLSFCMLCCLCCLSWLIDNTFQLFKAKKIDKVNNSVLTGGLLIITRDIARCCCYCSECASTLGVEATRQAFFFFLFQRAYSCCLSILVVWCHSHSWWTLCATTSWWVCFEMMRQEDSFNSFLYIANESVGLWLNYLSTWNCTSSLDTVYCMSYAIWCHESSVRDGKKGGAKAEK